MLSCWHGQKILRAKNLISLVTSKPLHGERLPFIRESFVDNRTEFKYESTSPRVHDVIHQDPTKLSAKLPKNYSPLVKCKCFRSISSTWVNQDWITCVKTHLLFVGYLTKLSATWVTTCHFITIILLYIYIYIYIYIYSNCDWVCSNFTTITLLLFSIEGLSPRRGERA
jgi:hypothetical protein